MSTAKGPLFVGVDLGTQSVKAALFSLNGTRAASASQQIPLHHAPDGTVEQSPDDFLAATTATIAACLSQAGCDPGRVGAVAVAGQMAGVLGVDRLGRAVTPYDSWLDTRCQPEVERLARTLGPQLATLTGCPPMVDHAPKMAWWHHHRPATYKKVAKFVVPSAFVASSLCDLPPDRSYIDTTHLHFTGVADAARAQWSQELAAAVDVDLDRLPSIVAPVEQVGELSAGAAARCGLLQGTPVAAGLGDTAAGALGAGVVWPGQVLDTSGTASVLAVSTDRFRPDPSGTLLMMRGALPGQWIALSYLAGGDLLTWLSNVFGTPLAELIEEAAVAPAGQLLFVPHLGGRILPAAPDARGAWLGLDFAQGRGDLVRSALESVAYEYAGFLRVATGLFPGLVPSYVRVIGGGSHDRFWNLVKASVLELPYARLHGSDFTCRGAAFVAAKAVGAVCDPGTAAFGASRLMDQVKPDPELSHVYKCRQGRYRALVEALRRSAKEAAA